MLPRQVAQCEALTSRSNPRTIGTEEHMTSQRTLMLRTNDNECISTLNADIQKLDDIHFLKLQKRLDH